MPVVPDRRWARSREALHAAVLQLAAAQPIESLSVTAVARLAEVHRSTFYEHAAAPFGLLRDALTTELDALRGPLDDPSPDVDEVVTTVTRSVLEHVLTHRAIYRRGLDAASAASLRPLLDEHFAASARVLVRRKQLVVPGDDEAGVRFVAHGTVGALVVWVASTDPRIDDFLSGYARLLPSWWPFAS